MEKTGYNLINTLFPYIRRQQREPCVQYNTIQYNTIQYNTIQYNTIQYNTIQYNTISLRVDYYSTLAFRAIRIEFSIARLKFK